MADDPQVALRRLDARVGLRGSNDLDRVEDAGVGDPPAQVVEDVGVGGRDDDRLVVPLDGNDILSWKVYGAKGGRSPRARVLNLRK